MKFNENVKKVSYKQYDIQKEYIDGNVSNVIIGTTNIVLKVINDNYKNSIYELVDDAAYISTCIVNKQLKNYKPELAVLSTFLYKCAQSFIENNYIRVNKLKRNDKNVESSKLFYLYQSETDVEDNTYQNQIIKQTLNYLETNHNKYYSLYKDIFINNIGYLESLEVVAERNNISKQHANQHKKKLKKIIRTIRF